MSQVITYTIRDNFNRTAVGTVTYNDFPITTLSVDIILKNTNSQIITDISCDSKIISSNSSILCVNNGTSNITEESLYCGDVYELTAVSSVGYKFKHWELYYDNSYSRVVISPSMQMNYIHKNILARAVFDQLPKISITLNIYGSGTVELNGILYSSTNSSIDAFSDYIYRIRMIPDIVSNYDFNNTTLTSGITPLDKNFSTAYQFDFTIFATATINVWFTVNVCKSIELDSNQVIKSSLTTTNFSYFQDYYIANTNTGCRYPFEGPAFVDYYVYTLLNKYQTIKLYLYTGNCGGYELTYAKGYYFIKECYSIYLGDYEGVVRLYVYGLVDTVSETYVTYVNYFSKPSIKYTRTKIFTWAGLSLKTNISNTIVRSNGSIYYQDFNFDYRIHGPFFKIFLPNPYSDGSGKVYTANSSGSVLDVCLDGYFKVEKI